jgi:UDP-glucuronate 4-epimerase
MHILLTGAAGFIGFHTARALLARGHSIVGIDNLNAYYDPALKLARLKQIDTDARFRFARADIAEPAAFAEAARNERYDVILHLAAQAGVRYALKDPASYTRSNLVGFQTVLEFARHYDGLAHLVYASSSSVYGDTTKVPFSEDACAVQPTSYYGATKRAGELLGYSYASLYGLKQTGLRFFTVYGPWGRPDMAAWLFTDAILRDRPIPVFGGGKLRRDFTYIDDIVDGVVRIVEKPFAGPEGEAPHRVYNLGNSHPEGVRDLVRHIESATGKKATIEDTKGPPGDLRETYADVTRAARDFGFAPKISLEEGISRFVGWFRQYHRL